MEDKPHHITSEGNLYMPHHLNVKTKPNCIPIFNRVASRVSSTAFAKFYNWLEVTFFFTPFLQYS